MKLIVCEECKKRYDCEKDDFCPKCGAYRLPHRICTSCWTYNGRNFSNAEVEAEK